MNKRKGLLPSEEFHMTIRQSTIEDDTLRLVWTCDHANNEDYLWRNLVQTFNVTSDFEMGKLHSQCEVLNFQPYPHWHEEFAPSFVGLRGLLDVGRRQKGNYMVNFIKEIKMPKYPADVDVTRERTDEYFFHENTKRDLPI